MHENGIENLERENRLLRKQIKDVQNRYEEKIGELSIIRELGMALLYFQDFKQICRYVLEIIIDNTIGQNCSIMLYDHKKKQLFLLCATNPLKKGYFLEPRNVISGEDLIFTFRPGEGVAGKAFLEKQSVLVSNAKESDVFTSNRDSEVKINSLLSIPLIIKDESMGVINISHADGDVFKQNDVYLLNVLAGYIAILIHSAINYEKLQYSEANYKALSEYSNNGIAIIQDDVHYYANPKYQELTGYTIDSLKNVEFEKLLKNVDPRSDLNKILSDLKRESNNEIFSTQLRKKNGGIIDVEISASSVIYNGKRTMIISMLDITYRKILERQIINAQKMQSMGTLAGGIAHNFNNLLMGIQGNASIALMEMDSGNSCYHNLESIEKLVKNGSKLTNQLLGYAREGKFEVKPINLNNVIVETSETFGAARRDIRIYRDFTKSIFGVPADQGQIEQTLLNIYINAADVMPEGGELFIKTSNIMSEDIQDKPYKPKPGNYVHISIRDTGVGMNKETMERIFEPFFTTKGLAKGTGLGLASAYGIVKGHGGYIDVDSIKGKGTIFNIYLPATDRIILKERELPDKIHMGTGTVLLIDDEEIVIDAGEQMLNKLGYDVVIARNGKVALDIFKEKKDSISIVLLDMVMPDMGGKETFEKMKEIDPGARVLLSSGYSLDGQASEIMSQGCDGFIQKPFSLKNLSQKVKEVLEKNC